jgi:hypothetical protein
VDAALALALAELRVFDPRGAFAKARPHARLDDGGAVVVDLDDGPVPLEKAIPLHARASKGGPGSGGGPPGQLPHGWTPPAQVSKGMPGLDPLGKQSDYEKLKKEKGVRYVDTVAKGERR